MHVHLGRNACLHLDGWRIMPCRHDHLSARAPPAPASAGAAPSVLSDAVCAGAFSTTAALTTPPLAATALAPTAAVASATVAIPTLTTSLTCYLFLAAATLALAAATLALPASSNGLSGHRRLSRLHFRRRPMHVHLGRHACLHLDGWRLMPCRHDHVSARGPPTARGPAGFAG